MSISRNRSRHADADALTSVSGRPKLRPSFLVRRGGGHAMRLSGSSALYSVNGLPAAPEERGDEADVDMDDHVRVNERAEDVDEEEVDEESKPSAEILETPVIPAPDPPPSLSCPPGERPNAGLWAAPSPTCTPETLRSTSSLTLLSVSPPTLTKLAEQNVGPFDAVILLLVVLPLVVPMLPLLLLLPPPPPLLAIPAAFFAAFLDARVWKEPLIYSFSLCANFLSPGTAWSMRRCLCSWQRPVRGGHGYGRIKVLDHARRRNGSRCAEKNIGRRGVSGSASAKEGY